MISINDLKKLVSLSTMPRGDVFLRLNSEVAREYLKLKDTPILKVCWSRDGRMEWATVDCPWDMHLTYDMYYRALTVQHYPGRYPIASAIKDERISIEIPDLGIDIHSISEWESIMCNIEEFSTLIQQWKENMQKKDA